MKNLMIMHENGNLVTTSDGRGPGFRGCLNRFDRDIIDLINNTRPVYTIMVEDD